jgi:hypothetical protein
MQADKMKTVRTSVKHFPFFLLPFSFLSRGRKKLARQEMKKEKGSRKKNHMDFTGGSLRTLFR